jgi:hypothetical protein
MKKNEELMALVSDTLRGGVQGAIVVPTGLQDGEPDEKELLGRVGRILAKRPFKDKNYRRQPAEDYEIMWFHAKPACYTFVRFHGSPHRSQYRVVCAVRSTRHEGLVGFGMSFCSTKDQVDKNIGKGIALFRARQALRVLEEGVPF